MVSFCVQGRAWKRDYCLLSFEGGFYKPIILQNITPVWGNFTCDLSCHSRSIAELADFWGKRGEFRLPKTREGVERWGNRNVDPGNVFQGRAVAGGAPFPAVVIWNNFLWLWGITEVAEGMRRAAYSFLPVGSLSQQEGFASEIQDKIILIFFLKIFKNIY